MQKIVSFSVTKTTKLSILKKKNTYILLAIKRNCCNIKKLIKITFDFSKRGHFGLYRKFISLIYGSAFVSVEHVQSYRKKNLEIISERFPMRKPLILIFDM